MENIQWKIIYDDNNFINFNLKYEELKGNRNITYKELNELKFSDKNDNDID